ncbi:MAG: K+/H+ antiporter subunit F [Tabrizicola sp.]|nr:K+/H+ antiporter subunit F [Tabrizicola sp.]MDP3263551.1 K+/H+ antiporter subunit F [Tabrizicola sp.]MDP3649742.1 K+/H+ antiporter subunit F [Paracoccaceae bacterium]MDZ4070035.1 K+/H+ antiporter subunit F [Tabrizicola sp.]
MLSYALDFAIGAFGLCLVLNLIRLFTGPTLTDRILAVDTMTVNALALVMLTTVRSGSNLLFEAALLLALTGFIGTVAYCKFLLRGSIIE